MITRFISRGILTAVFTAACATAGPVDYAVNFNVAGNPISDPAGSFRYDAAAPLGSQFSVFTVTMQGFTFDFTGAANAGPAPSAISGNPCGSSVDSASTFALLSGTLCGGSGSTNRYSGTLLFTTRTLVLDILNSGAVRSISANAFSSAPGPLFPVALGDGNFSIKATSIDTSTPEPSTAGLLALAGGVAAMAVRRRRKTA